MLAAAVLVTAAPAVARQPRSATAPLTPTGAISVSWHGDPARGCAAAGLCAYRGSLSLRPSSEGQLQVYRGPRGLSDAFAYVTVSAPPTIRVQRGSEGACVDLLPIGDIDLFFSGAGRQRLRASLEGPSLDPGRCAGPALDQVLSRLHGRAFTLARLRRGGLTIPLTGRVSFADGHFSGTVVSTLRLRAGRLVSDRYTSSADRPPRDTRAGRRVRIAAVKARYRVTGLTGKLTTAFAGLAAPFCTNLDACGVSGNSSWGILSAGGTVLLEGGAIARPGDHGLGGVLAAIARGRGRQRGSVATDGRLRHALGGTTTTVTRPDGPDCRDSHSAQAPDLGTAIAHDRIPLQLGGEGVYSSGGDLVRTGCPGPQQSEVLGSSSVASGSAPLSALRRRPIEVPLQGRSSFRDPAYSGTRRARFTVGLRRVAMRVSYRWVRVGR